MKTLMLLVAVLLVTGCTSTADMRFAGPEGQARRLFEKRVTGTYEVKVSEGGTIKWVISRGSGAQEYRNGVRSDNSYSCTVMEPTKHVPLSGIRLFDAKKKEIYMLPFPFLENRKKPILVFKINPDDSITRIGTIYRSSEKNIIAISNIGGGKVLERIDDAKEKQITFKRITQSSP